MLAKFCFFLSRQKNFWNPSTLVSPGSSPFDKGPKAKTNLRRLKVGKKGVEFIENPCQMAWGWLRFLEMIDEFWWGWLILTQIIFIWYLCVYIYIYTYVFFFCVFWRTKSLDLVSFILLDLGSLFHYIFCLYILSYYLFSLLIFLGIMTYCFFNCARTGHMEKYQGSMTYNSDT